MKRLDKSSVPSPFSDFEATSRKVAGVLLAGMFFNLMILGFVGWVVVKLLLHFGVI